MEIKNQKSPNDKVELRSLKQENAKLKKALEESELTIQSLKKKLEKESQSQSFREPKNMPGTAFKMP